MNRTMRSKNSGNMLIYILGAILLLGLLIVLIKGSFQEGTGIDPEKVMLQVNEARRFTGELERAVSYIIQDGASETELRFAHPTGDAAYAAYGTIATTPTRQVFSPSGGGAEWRNPPVGSQVASAPWHFTSGNTIWGVGSNTNPAGRDLAVILPNVTKDFCLRVNTVLGLDNPGGNPRADQDWFVVNLPFTGAYLLAGGANMSYTIGGVQQSPGPEGCLGVTTAAGGGVVIGQYYYYRVLLAR